MTVAHHTFDVQLDDDLAEPSKSETTRDVVKRKLTKDLDDMRASYPAAFAREMPRLRRLVIAHPEAKEIRVTIVLADPSAEIADGRVVHALSDQFFREVDPRFRGRAPEQIGAGEGADWFDWARLREMNPDLVTLDVLRFVAAPGASDPAVAKHLRSWLVDQAEDLSRRGIGMPDPPASLVAVRGAYVRWLVAAAPSFDADTRLDLALPIFRLPQGTLAARDAAYGYAAPEPTGRRWAWDGFDVFAFGAASVDAWIAKNATNPVRAFFQNAVATEEGTKRLAQLLGTRDDARFIETAVRAIPDEKRRQALAKELEAYPSAAAKLRNIR